jgi:hypothetical protein
MTQPDEITMRLDVIARLLELNGYAVEVDYTGATVLVWADEWPILVKLGHR